MNFIYLLQIIRASSTKDLKHARRILESVEDFVPDRFHEAVCREICRRNRSETEGFNRLKDTNATS